MPQQITPEFILFTFALGYTGNLFFQLIESVFEKFFDWNGMTSKQKSTLVLGTICFGVVVYYSIKIGIGG